ncbi:MAG: hypothetical protein H8E66_27660, partial [Planctomycetes bacterium]|nr:hypothetical protein [Planctomycetota bacterium]
EAITKAQAALLADQTAAATELNTLRELATEMLHNIRQTTARDKANTMEVRDGIAQQRDAVFAATTADKLKQIDYFAAADAKMAEVVSVGLQADQQIRVDRNEGFASFARAMANNRHLGVRADLTPPPPPLPSPSSQNSVGVAWPDWLTYTHYLFGRNETPIDGLDSALNVGTMIGRGMVVLAGSGLVMVAAAPVVAGAVGTYGMAAIYTVGAGMAVHDVWQTGLQFYRWDYLSVQEREDLVAHTALIGIGALVGRAGLKKGPPCGCRSWLKVCFVAGTPVHANSQSGEVWYAGAGIALVGTIGGVVVSERRRKRRQQMHDDCFLDSDEFAEDNETSDWHNDLHEGEDMNFDELCDRLFHDDADFWGADHLESDRHDRSHHAPSDEPTSSRSGSRLTSTGTMRTSGRSLTYLARHSESNSATSLAERDTQLLTQPSTNAVVATETTESVESSSWWRKLNAAGFFCGLLLAAMLLAKGYRVETSPTRPIEQVKVGERVLVNAPEEALATDFARLNGFDASWNASDGSLEVDDADDPLRQLASATPEAVTQADYRLIKLHATEVWPDGTIDNINVETLQPWQWLHENEVHVGGKAPLPLDAEEMGLTGNYTCKVLDILPIPELERGPGRVVLTTVNHLNRDVRELTLRDTNGTEETLRPTGNHKFYSVSRGEWLAASELQNGERLDGINGEVTVVSSRTIPGKHRVYNFTVQGEHLYRVANCGVLVHNQCPKGLLSLLPDFRSGRLLAEHYAKHVKGVMVRSRGRLVPKKGGPDMPEFNSMQEYHNAARQFHSGAPGQGVHEAVRADGDFVRFDPATGYFGIRTSDGIVKTFFRPDGDAIAQFEYFLKQLF